MTIADYNAGSGRWTLYANTQGGWLIKNLIGQVFGADPAKFRVITPDVGGGFGMKAFLYAEHVLTCYAARKLGRPVKWMSDRSEAFVADTQGRDNITLGELAIDKDGKFLALRTRNVANMGAYLSTFAPYIPTLAGGAVLSGVYDFKQIYANVLGVFTHTVPDSMRSAILNARPMSLVQTPAPSPKRTSFAIATASSSVSKRITDRTGPNTSCCASGLRLSTSPNTAGLRKKPEARSPPILSPP